MVPTESKVDVLIIGAGPAGLMCANALSRSGVSVRIVDKRSIPVTAGQADSLQPRTIEVMQSYGLADRLIRESNQMHRVAFYSPGRDGGIQRTKRAPEVIVPARYPFKTTLNQGATEAMFIDSMRENGVKVEMPVLPESIVLSEDQSLLEDPNAYVATVVLNHGADKEKETVHAKFVIGADGAHSWVRKTFGIEMEGNQSDFAWGALDLVPDTEFPDIRTRCAIHSPHGSCMIIPRERELVRLYIQMDEVKADESTGRINATKMTPDGLLEIARKIFAPYRMDTKHPFDWWTVWIVGQRVASNYSVKERVLIVGDACHTHSPMAGQGMNAGMNDGHNLCWKLVNVLRGVANLSLLKTYNFERRQYARDLIAFDKEWSTLWSTKPQSEHYKDGVTPEQFFNVYRKHGGFSSGIGVHYAPSAIVDPSCQVSANHLTVGKRIPPHTFVRMGDARPFELQDLILADNKFKILVFTGDLANPVQLAVVEELAESNAVFLKEGWKDKVFDIVCICAGEKDSFGDEHIPTNLKPDWTRALIDTTDMNGKGGGGYIEYGVDTTGAIVVVRPDGYIGFVAPLECVEEVNAYFASFLKI